MKGVLPIEQIKERIELFLLEQSRPLLTEPGRDVVDLSSSSYSLSTQYDKLVWHIWNENTNLVRQITGILSAKPGRLELRYQRFGKGPAGTLILAESRAMPEHLDRRARRTQYLRTLRRWLHQLFPEWKVEELTTEADLARTFSGRYARGLMARGTQAWAVIGSGEQADDFRSDDILAYGLLWLDWLRTHHSSGGSRVVAGLRIFLPRDTAEVTLNRLAWLHPQAGKWELFETGFEVGEEVRRRDPADFGNLKTRLTPLTKPAMPARAVEETMDAIVSANPEVETRSGPDGALSWSVRGLVFARHTSQGIVFGLGRCETPLQQETAGELKELVGRMVRVRRADSTEVTHPLYRLQPERWMESMVSRQLNRLEPGLTAGIVYEQVPAVSGTARGLLDLLTANASGRLAVIELKASEDLQLPLQALDYWMRVHWHHQRGELQREGYFAGCALSPQPPLLLLVSPALQFHSACEVILRYLSPNIEVVGVGLNEDWRRAVKVVSRQAGRGS